MSRLRNLKDRKRKNIMKATSYGLALALFIGSSNGMTTYALFTDKEKIASDLAISMGDLDVEIGEGLNVEDLKLGEIKTHNFEIGNKGTLKQKIKLKFPKYGSDTLEQKYFKYIEYKLDIKTSNGNKVIINQSGELLNEDGSRLILAPGESLLCTSTIKIKDGITPEEKNLLSGKKINFDIKVLASQVNYIDGVLVNEEKGFTDKEIQSNQVTIGEISSCENLAPNLDVEFDDGRKEIEIEIPTEYEDNKKLDLVSVKILGGTGEFFEVEVEMEDGKPDVDEDDFDIVKISGDKFNKNNIGECFSDEQKLRVLLKFKGKYAGETITVEEVWEIKFRINKETEHLEAYYVVLNRDKSIDTIVETDTVELPKEETEVPSNPEVVELPKEEKEVPNNPEVVEPLNEEIEVPNKPEVIEPLKENEELQ